MVVESDRLLYYENGSSPPTASDKPRGILPIKRKLSAPLSWHRGSGRIPDFVIVGTSETSEVEMMQERNCYFSMGDNRYSSTGMEFIFKTL